MFSPLQIKQEYPATSEDVNNRVNVAGVDPSQYHHRAYPLFTSQDVEYMYRQLPQFWTGQNANGQLQPIMSNNCEGRIVEQQNNINNTMEMQQPTHSPVPGYANNVIPNLSYQEVVVEEEQVETTTSQPGRGPGRPSNSSSNNSEGGKKSKCQCEICFKEFGHKSNLFIHMRTHNGERPYKCTECDKRFTHSGNLAIHMRTHSGERPYACQVCGKMFSHSGNLSTHLRTHSGVKPYKCSVCNKEFRHSGNLSIHERIHSGVKPFRCKFCGKEFYHSGNLTTHLKKHNHPLEPTTAKNVKP